MKKSILLLAITVVGISSYSCTKDEVKEDTPDECSDNYTYDADVSSIISTNCLGCHAVGGSTPTLTTYAEVVNSINSIKNAVIVNKTMPMGGALTDSQLEIINCWIEQDTPEN